MPRRKKAAAVIPDNLQSGGIIDPSLTVVSKPTASVDEFFELPGYIDPSDGATVEFEEDPIENDPLVIAAKTNDRRLLLMALRDKLAVTLAQTTSGRDVAAISRNLNIISAELDAIPDPDAEELDPVEQMRKKVLETQTS